MLYNSKYKNDFDVNIANTKIEVDKLQSGCMNNDFDNRRKNLISRLVSTIDNIKSAIMAASNTKILIIIYCNKGDFTLLNNQDNFFDFFIIFSPLFFLMIMNIWK